MVRLFHDTVNLTVPDGNHAEIGGAGVFFYENGVFDILDFCHRLRIDIIIAGQEQEVSRNPGFCLPECMGGAELFFLDDHFNGQIESGLRTVSPVPCGTRQRR